MDKEMYSVKWDDYEFYEGNKGAEGTPVGRGWDFEDAATAIYAYDRCRKAGRYKNLRLLHTKVLMRETDDS